MNSLLEKSFYPESNRWDSTQIITTTITPTTTTLAGTTTTVQPENTCHDCDPPIPDTLYVTFPTDLDEEFGKFAGNTYAVPWDSDWNGGSCHWELRGTPISNKLFDNMTTTDGITVTWSRGSGW